MYVPYSPPFPLSWTARRTAVIPRTDTVKIDIFYRPSLQCTLGVFPALAFAADFSPAAPEFHQHTPQKFGHNGQKIISQNQAQKNSESPLQRKQFLHRLKQLINIRHHPEQYQKKTRKTCEKCLFLPPAVFEDLAEDGNQDTDCRNPKY